MHPLLIWLPALLLLAASLWLAWPLWRRWHAQRQLEQRIAALGDRQLRDVMLDDGMGGHSYFEWLLLTEQGICLLNTKRYHGNIFAGERLEKWSQVVGSRSYYFTNPLYDLEPLSATLRYHLPGVPLQAAVLFVGECRFPKGHPAAVMTRDELLKEGRMATIPLKLQQAWERLENLVRHPDPQRESHLLPHREEGPHWRLWLAAGLSLLALVWVLWGLWQG